MRTERGPNDRGEWARERYGVGEYGRGEDRFGFGRHERERGTEGRYEDRGQWGTGSYYGRADYGIGLGGWREQGRAMMDSDRYRQDMPGMGTRGDYGMDDSRRRDMDYRDYRQTQSWGRDYGRSGMTTYGMRDQDMTTGRGPRSYTRSDDRIREDVCERLMESWMNSEDVDVRVESGEVTLTGLVDTRHEKRAIEDLTEMVLGVREVHNQLRVRGGLKGKLGMEHRTEEGRNVNAGIAGGVGSTPSSTNSERPPMARASAPGSNGTGGSGPVRS
jgi:osmotically-inducible protein OsmY